MMNPDMEMLKEEKSRDNWLAASAAKRIAAKEFLSAIETEPLEALAEMVRQELQDRDYRESKVTLPLKPF